MSSDPHLVCLEDYPIHTVTGLVKQWLRELPDPLMTFTHYNDFLHAVGEEDLSHQEGSIFQSINCAGLLFSVVSVFFPTIGCWIDAVEGLFLMITKNCRWKISISLDLKWTKIFSKI